MLLRGEPVGDSPSCLLRADGTAVLELHAPKDVRDGRRAEMRELEPWWVCGGCRRGRGSCDLTDAEGCCCGGGRVDGGSGEAGEAEGEGWVVGWCEE